MGQDRARGPAAPSPGRPDEPPTERIDPVRTYHLPAPPPALPAPPRAAPRGSAGDGGFLISRGPVGGATRWPGASPPSGPGVATGPHGTGPGPGRRDDGTGTFSAVLLAGLGGSVEAPAPGPPPVSAPAGAPPRARDRAVATVRRLAGRIAALRGDERTALLAVGAVVGMVLLILAGLIVVVRLTGGGDTATPAPTQPAAAPPAVPSATPEPTPTGSPLPPSAGSFAARHSGLCLAAPQGRTDSGAQLVQRACGTDFGTGFLLVGKDQPDTYALVDAGTSRCADVYGASADNGAPVVQWDCNGGANQTFQLRPVTDATGVDTGYVQLVALHSGKCLDVVGLSRDENALIQQYDCRDPVAESDPAAGNQSWKFSPT